MNATEFAEGSVQRAVLDSLGDGVTIADARGRIVFSNRAADAILGIGATDAAPETWADHYGVFLTDEITPFPTDRYPLVRALQGEDTDGTELFIRNPSVPEGCLISVTGRALRDHAGRITGASVVFRDVTALRRTEQALTRANARLVEANVELQKLQHRQAELSALIVHDLKSPLTGIMASAQLLLRASSDDTTGECAQGILDAGRSMHRMALDLLDVHVGEDGSLRPDAAPFDLGRLMLDVSQAMQSSASPRRQRIEVRAGDRLAPLQADEELLRRVLQNLVDNCIKYGPAGGTILLGATEAERERVLITVSDEGPGVPPALREKIFEKYAQVERETVRSRDSRGLGLRFCRLAVEAHGGTIWVESAEPRGARFCVQLPRHGASSSPTM